MEHLLLKLQSSDAFANVIIAFLKNGWNEFSNKSLDAIVFLNDDLTSLVGNKWFWTAVIATVLFFLFRKIFQYFGVIREMRSENE